MSQDQPIVLICQTGKRSSLGAMILKEAGFKQVANMAGGKVRWRG